MIKTGLLDRVALGESSEPGGTAKRAAYRLTPKAYDLAPALVALTQWGDRWISGKGREPMKVLAPTGKKIASVKLRTQTGQEIRPQDLRWAAGLGADERTRGHVTRARLKRLAPFG